MTGSGADRHVKSDASKWYAVIDDRLIELGGKRDVEARRAVDRTRFFQLESDKGGYEKVGQPTPEPLLGLGRHD